MDRKDPRRISKRGDPESINPFQRRTIMAKRVALAVLAAFICWVVLDFVIHGILLRQAYGETAGLWRPMEEMKMGLMYLVTFISCLAFVLIYALLVGKKGLGTGVAYGCLFGLGAGISMGYGTYSVQPIPYMMALSWFLGTLVEGTLAGLIVGAIVKDDS
jgi:hypothetical protein